jgi:mono/diheme cytochrome c family protein
MVWPPRLSAGEGDLLLTRLSEASDWAGPFAVIESLPSGSFSMKAFVLFIALLAGPAWANDPAVGKELVEGYRCQECHTPKVGGKLDPTKYLKGAGSAVALAGMPNITEERMKRLLKTGTRPDGSSPRMMPRYRMSEEEAAAIIEYLRSLK